MLFSDILLMIKLLECSVENKGNFLSVDPDNIEDVVSAFKAELSQSDYHSLVDKEGYLRYQEIILGIRQYKRYIFCIDNRNSLNQEIKKSINCKPFKLSLKDKSYCFYLILNINDLDSFLTAFFRWVDSFSDSE